MGNIIMTNVINGDGNNNTLTGTAGWDDIYGYGGNDFLFGGGGNDFLSGGGDDDVLRSGAGDADTVDGGNGVDTADYLDSWTGVYVDLTTGYGSYGTATGERLFDIENLNGSGYDDTLIGNAAANVLSGFDGNDKLSGGGGNDQLYGLQGNDTLGGGGGADTLFGGIGIDTAIYDGSSTGVWVDLTTGYGYSGDAEGDTLYEIENVTGSSLDDTLIGDANANLLNGLAGHDGLRGGAGGDFLYAGAGDDHLEGGAGADALYGDLGIDTATYHNSSTGVNIDLASGKGSNGDAAGDLLYKIENVTGSNFDDTLIGDANANLLGGLRGQDTLNGGLGADDLYAGGTHAGYFDNVRDTFVYANIADSGTTSTTWDQIFQFDRAESTTDTTSDKIDLRSLDADPASGDQAFRFVKDFTSPKGKQAEGQVQVVDTGSDVNVEIDINGDNVADSIIQVMNIDTLTSSDFLL